MKTAMGKAPGRATNSHKSIYLKKKNGHKSITARMSYCYRFSSLAYALSL